MPNVTRAITKEELRFLPVGNFVKSSRVQEAWLHYGASAWPCYILGYITDDDFMDPQQVLVLRISKSVEEPIGNRVVVDIAMGKKLEGTADCMHKDAGSFTGLMEVRLHK